MLFYLACLLAGMNFSWSLQPNELLEATDRARGGLKSGIVWEAELKSVEDGETTNRSFLVKAKDNNALVTATQPARNKGELFLFNGNNMWFYKPSIRKPMSISARQRLSGLASNGDMANTNYSEDYSILESNQKEIEGRKIVILLLKAKSPTSTYDKIRYYIDPIRKLAVKAEFLTLQGKPLKIAEFTYDNSLAIDSSKLALPFVSRMLIQDANGSNDQTVIEYKTPRIETLSSNLFNVNNLVR